MSSTYVIGVLDPAGLAWADAFVASLGAALDVASGELAVSLPDVVKRTMASTFQRHDPSHPLEQSLHAAPLPSLHGVHMEIGRDVSYALQREFGGTIRAVNAPYLVFQTYDGSWHRMREVTQEGSHYWEESMKVVAIVAPERYAQATHEALRAALALHAPGGGPPP